MCIRDSSGKEARNLDDSRKAGGVATRKATRRVAHTNKETGVVTHSAERTTKKAAHAEITEDQAKTLKTMHANSPQGRRDAVVMSLLLDHGLRVGELAALPIRGVDPDGKPTGLNLAAGTFTFYRQKVDKTQTHLMTPDTLKAVRAWMDNDAPAFGLLLSGSRKGGGLTGAMSERAITKRVRELGVKVGLYTEEQRTTKTGKVKAVKVGTLSAHDCRHYWATTAASKGTDAFALRDAGGWSSLAMPSRYVEQAKIANAGVKL